MSGQFEASREGQMTEKSLKWGYWWVTHKVQVRFWFSVVVGIAGFVMLAYGLYGFADWYFGSGVRERQVLGEMTKQVIPYAAYNEARAPVGLLTDPAFVLAGGTGKYDLIAAVTNPNTRWVARFTYHFEAGSVKTDRVAGYALPTDKTYLTQIGYKSDAGLAGASLIIEDLHWTRVDPHETQPEYAAWSTARLAVNASDTKFLRPATGDALGNSRAVFKLTNDSAFGYYKVGLVVLLWGEGGQLIGANHIIVSDLRSGDRRDVEAVWFGDVPGVATVEVKPIIDLFDARNYIPVGK